MDGDGSYLATFLSGLAGTHAAGFVLTRQEPAGKWTTATYAVTKPETRAPKGIGLIGWMSLNSAEPVTPVRPMGPMPDDLDSGAVPAGGETAI